MMNKDVEYWTNYFEDDTEFLQELEDNEILNEYDKFVSQYECETKGE